MNRDKSGTENPRRNVRLVSVVLPTCREADNLPLLVRRIVKVLRPIQPFEIIIVDDNSKDGTIRIAEELALAGYPVRLITRIAERGLSSAVIRGFSEARGDLLLCMDADLSHPPEAIPHLLKCLEDSQVDMVIGSRYVPGAGIDKNWSILRWFNSKIATLLARPFVNVKDPLAGFLAVPRKVFERAQGLAPIGYKIGLELMVKCGCRHIREVPIHFSNRRFGQSKLTVSEQINYLRHLVRLTAYRYRRLFRQM